MHVFREYFCDVVNLTLISHFLRIVFRTLTANIRRRRGSKVAINLPIFVDENTPRPFIDPTIPWDRNIYPEDSGEFDLQNICLDPVELIDYIQRPSLVRPYRITSIWMQWALEWVVLVCSLRSRPVTSLMLDVCTTA